MKRLCLIIMLITISIVQSGCWNRKELNELGIVIASAIDLDEDNQWVTSFQVVIPQAIVAQTGGINQSPVTVFSTKGKTLQESVQNANLETPRTLFYAHNRVIIISDRVAEKGVSQIADFYLRHPQNRETTGIVITKGNARRLMEVLIPLERIPGNAIDRIIAGGEENLSIVRKIKMYEFTSSLTNPTTSAVLPKITITGTPDGQTSLESLKATKSRAVMKLDGMAVFKQDKLVGWLNREESMGLAWASNHIENTVVNFPCGEANNSNSTSSFLVEKSDTKLKPKITDGKLEMTVDIKAKGSLLETACKLNLQDPATSKQLEKRIEKKIKKDVIIAFQEAKKLKTDVFGFGDAFHKKYPKEWKLLSEKWEDSFKEIKVNVVVNADIRRTGMIIDPVTKEISK